MNKEEMETPSHSGEPIPHCPKCGADSTETQYITYCNNCSYSSTIEDFNLYPKEK